MKAQGKKIYFIVFAMILGSIFIPNAFAEGPDDSEILIGEWIARSLFQISGSDEEIEIYHINSEPEEEPIIIYEQDGTGMMQSFGVPIPFTWEFGDTGTGASAAMSIDELGITMDVYISSENVISVASYSDEQSVEMMTLERIIGY